MNNELMINNIKELCKNRNITVTELEETLGFSQGLIGRWKNKSPSIDRVVDIANYFGLSIDEVIGKSKECSDQFINIVYNGTSSGLFKWNKVDQNSTYIVAPKMSELYNEDVYNEIYYFTNIEDGYLTIRCFSEYNKTLKPKELDLYIQPSSQSDRVYQNYSVEQLLPLWVLILSRSDDAPDDVKAENLKQKLLMPSLFDRTQRMNAYVDGLKNINKQE